MVSRATAAREGDGSADGVSSARGRIDRVENGALTGWARDEARGDEPVRVQVRAGGAVLGEALADEYRETLEHAGVGHGRHGFRIPLEVPFSPGSVVELTLFDAACGLPLVADACNVVCLDSRYLDDAELDGRSLRAPPPPPPMIRPGRRIRRMSRRLAGPVRRLVPRRPREQPAPVTPALPAGTLARLGRIDEVSVDAVSSLDLWPPLQLPAVEAPQVSIVIPVHDQFHLTYQCLVSLILGAGRTSFEVLVVDDRSNDATREIESRVANLRVVRNEQNLGFLRSCMRAAEEARGDYLLFLNNDTEVEHGWLDELHGVFERFEGVGAVGAKLVYPDGRLQDAGGIVWDSGTPWNVGHGRDPDDPEFNYVRDVDYLTGAALMVERGAWERVGGFTDAYAPAYYEDTDLAFKLRAAGYRTLYCPQAKVVHYEGRSNGTSLEEGIKQYQVVNATRFKDTWRDAFVGRGAEGVDLRRNKDRERGLRVLVIDHEYPRLGRDAGSYAALQEMKLLTGLGCKVTFLPRNLFRAGTHVDALQRLGIECVYSPWHRSVEGFLESRGREFDVVYVTRYAVAEDVLDVVRRTSEAKIVFNNADLHFLRELRGALERGDSDLSGPRRTRERELAVMGAVDAVLSYNDVEQAIIASHLMRDDHVFTCPWVLEADASSVPFEEREGIAFLGGFGHPPNREAMDWFIERVMPLLRAARPSLELHVWGSQLPADAGWERRDGVVVRGYARSLDEVFDSCRVFVAPLRSGAGIKGKVLDSLARGVPTVLSPVAAEGTGLVDGLSTLVASSPESWVESILSLVDDAGLWHALSAASLELRDTRYSREHGIARMREVFDALGLDIRDEFGQVRKR